MPENYITEKGHIDRQKKESALYKRYEEKDTGKPASDFDNWEQQQIEFATKKSAKASKAELEADDYDYVFDEQQIDFVLESTLHANRKKDEIIAQIDEVKRRGILASIKFFMK